MAPALQQLLQAKGAAVTADGDGALVVTSMMAAEIGEIAAANRIVLHELSPQRASLEEAFIELTRESVQYHAGGAEPTPVASAGARS